MSTERKRRPPAWALVLIAILGTLALACGGVVALVVFLVPVHVVSELQPAQQGVAKADIMRIVHALQGYAARHDGRYPETLQALVEPDEGGFTPLGSGGLPLDPWGHEYGYQPPGAGRVEPRVFSYGADGAPGGEGQDLDIDDVMIRDRDI